MSDLDPSVRYLVFAHRAGRGWKLAHGNLHTMADALAARDEIAAQEGVLEARLNRVSVETVA